MGVRDWLFIAAGLLGILAALVWIGEQRRERRETRRDRQARAAAPQPPATIAPQIVPSKIVPPGDLIAFDYADADGVVTRRMVAMRSGGRRYIRGWCFLRQDDRTFRMDRVLAYLDPVTGERLPSLAAARRASVDARAAAEAKISAR